ncbi:MAG: stage II sporulation protein M [Flavobacteriales bacterium]|nr:stage II sporulation protein M [Flavobacteriales bacterium]
MREAAFINRNKEKWQRLEKAADDLGKLSADEANDLYIELTDDLSYARTFFPKSNVTSYLNGVSARVHQMLHRNERTDRNRFITFWTTEVPLAMAKTRTALLVSFIVFALSMGVGMLSTAHDPSFVRLMLGDGYVNMTLDNIKNGRPMDVYDSMDEGFMFSYITINNIMVSLMTFGKGLFTALWPGISIANEGFRIGSFMYFFIDQGMGKVSGLTVMVHGTLELSALVIAGAAGMTLGNGLLFPGSYTRAASFKRGAMLGLKVVIGLVPIFMIAGFLESFVTRHAPVLNEWVSGSIIAVSGTFIIFYFLIYPFIVERRLRAIPRAKSS